MKPSAAAAPEPGVLELYASSTRLVRRRNIRIALILLSLLIPAGLSLDYFVYPQHMPTLFGIRAWSTLVVVVLLIFLNRSSDRWLAYFEIAMIATPQIAMCIMIYATEGAASPYYAGLNLILGGVLWIAQLRTKRSIGTFIFTLFAYLTACLLHGPTEGSDLFNNVYFLVLSGIIMITGNFFLTRLRLADFTSRLELEENRKTLEKTNQQLVEADQLKTRFFANISHELRTPLTLIAAPLDQLLAEEKSDPIRPTLTTMRDNSLRLLGLINDLLALARLQAGEDRPALHRVDLPDFLRRLVRSVETYAESRKITLTLELEESCRSLAADPERLQKMLLNPLFNALKFTPPRGSVELRTLSSDDHVEILIADNGPGIPEHLRERVFEAFQQADNEDTREFQGAGIGLALVRELAEAHGGSVRAEETPGGGTTIRLQLPRLSDAELDELPSPTEINSIADVADSPEDPSWLSSLYRRAEYQRESEGKKGAIREPSDSVTKPVLLEGEERPKVLVADDEPQMRGFLADLLSSEYEVVAASHGTEALELIQSQSPTLAILDYMMPELTGLDVCRELRSKEATRDLPVILLTARADEDTKLTVLEAGATDFVAKPFHPRELLNRSRNLVGLRVAQLRIESEARHLEGALNQLRSAEEKLVHAAKMSSLGQFAAGIIHEVNNPISWSLAALGILEAEIRSGRISDDSIEVAEDLRTGLERASEIIKDLRTYSHPDPTLRESVDLTELAQTGARFVGHQLELLGIQIDLQATSDAMIRGNRNELTQVLTNFLLNAIDGIEERINASGAEFRPSILISVENDHEEVRLCVEDNGAGATQETLDHLFDPFFTTKEVGRGVGLGLSTSARIVQNHGGRLEATSEPGHFFKMIANFPIE